MKLFFTSVTSVTPAGPIKLIRLVALGTLVAAALLPAPVYAEEVIEETPSGGVNWTQGVVFAHGYGTAREDLSNAQRRILSRRAAIVDGQRNLLEITKGVRINSVLKTDQAMQQSREVATRVEGIIKGAQPVKEHYQNDVYTVTMAMPIEGEFLKVVWPADSRQTAQWEIMSPARMAARLRPILVVGDVVMDFLIPAAHAADPIVIRDDKQADAYRKLLEWLETGSAENVRPMLERAIIDFETNNQFSGLLIDASGVPGFELATIPKIRDEEGNVLYPSSDTSYNDIVNNRGVTYDFDLQDAVRNQRVATTPFIIKALDTYKNLASDLIITRQDAARVKQSPSTLEAMNKAGVLIVVAI